jgi:hypothetical protein
MNARIPQILAISLCAAAFGLPGHGQSRDLPRLKTTGEDYRLVVDGKPNSSGFPDALRALHNRMTVLNRSAS